MALGEAVQAGWKTLGERNGFELHVGGIPQLSHFTFERANGRECDHAALKALFIQEMLERGFLASNIYYAMCAHTDEDVERYLAAVDECLAVLAAASGKGEVASLLRGLPAAAGFKRIS
jgi:glutamate-1-semialdehyde 2,1-aminomutase